jgi:hypothetical protein
MRLPKNRNDRAFFGAIGAMAGAAVLVGLGTAQIGALEFMTSTAQAAVAATQTGVTALAHTQQAKNLATIVRSPTDLPGPIGNRAPRTVRVELETIE